MVVKKPFRGEAPSDVRLKAGFNAEKQMAFYLKRAFAETEDIHVYNGLRFMRRDEVAQIDHLVLHRYGFTLVESKSITGKVEVNRHLEFVRVGKKREGMKSPISQVEMQAELLQKLLNDDKESLRKKVLLGLIQAEFGDVRFTKIVAISDNGEIIRRQCDPPELMKADRVVAAIRDLIAKRDQAQGLKGLVRRSMADRKTAKEMDEHDMVRLSDDELLRIHKFIRRQHCEGGKKIAAAIPPSVPDRTRSSRKRPVDRSANLKASRGKAYSTTKHSSAPSKVTRVAPSAETPPRLREVETRPEERPRDKTQPLHTCQHCAGSQLRILYGPYGYYFECLECQRNTKIAVLCSSCGAKARVSKRKLEFAVKCKECGRTDHFYSNPS